MDEGRAALPSSMGAIFSIVLNLLIWAFAYYKIRILIQKTNIDILAAVTKDHYDDSYIFGAEQGLNIAVAVINRQDP